MLAAASTLDPEEEPAPGEGPSAEQALQGHLAPLDPWETVAAVHELARPSSPTDDARQPHRGAYAIRPPVTRSNLSQNGNCRSSAAELNHKINS